MPLTWTRRGFGRPRSGHRVPVAAGCRQERAHDDQVRRGRSWREVRQKYRPNGARATDREPVRWGAPGLSLVDGPQAGHADTCPRRPV